MFDHGRHADDGQFIFLAIEVAGEAQTKLARIQAVVFTATLGVQAYGTDDVAVRDSGEQLVMEGVTEAAAFIDGVDGMADLNLLADSGQQPGGSKTLGRFGPLVIVRDGDGDLAQVHIQTQYEEAFDLGIVLGRDLCCVVHVMSELMVVFHLTGCVPVLHALVNPPWQLTATALAVSRMQ